MKRLVSFCYRVFSDKSLCKNPSAELLSSLGNDMSLLRFNDVPYDESLICKYQKPSISDAPACYTPVVEEKNFTICMFLLRKGSCLPLHDHPNMWGFVKVLHGSMLVHSVSLLENTGLEPTVIPAKLNFRTTLTSSDDCVKLTPEANLHLLEATNGPCLFLDLLFPPYMPNKGRDCHYYELNANVDIHTIEPTDRFSVREISTPDSYWCDFAPYQEDLC